MYVRHPTPPEFASTDANWRTRDVPIGPVNRQMSVMQKLPKVPGLTNGGWWRLDGAATLRCWRLGGRIDGAAGCGAARVPASGAFFGDARGAVGLCRTERAR